MAAPPELARGLVIGVANTLNCCPPPATAICSLPQLGKSNSTPASYCERNCAFRSLRGPVRSTSYFVADARLKLSIQPKSKKGGGGWAGLTSPCADGSNGKVVSLLRLTVAT